MIKYIHHIMISVIPLITYRGSVLLANIAAAFLLAESEFTKLSTAYLVAVLISTPAIAITNYKINLFNLKLSEVLYTVNLCTLMCFLTTLFIGNYLFNLTTEMLFFSGTVSIFVTYSSLSTLMFLANESYKYIKYGTFVASFIFLILISLTVINDVNNIIVISFFYLIYPMSVFLYISYSYFLGKVKPAERCETSKQDASHKDFPYLVATILLGSPIHLIALSLFNTNAISNSQISMVNLSFHWFVFITIIPAMITNVSVKFLRNTSNKKVYRLVMIIFSISLSLLFLLNIDLVTGLYPKYQHSIGDVLRVYMFAAIASVFYQVLINSLFANYRFKLALVMSFIYGAVYLLGTSVLTDIEGSGVLLGISMLFAYLSSVLFYFLYYIYRHIQNGFI